MQCSLIADGLAVLYYYILHLLLTILRFASAVSIFNLHLLFLFSICICCFYFTVCICCFYFAVCTCCFYFTVCICLLLHQSVELKSE
ncbi:hypothetical protein MsAc7_07180 [Methanolapillus millepedarum]|uniref:Uncharacterized protein n=1 Tax=Methanolapillus millepedarum TaxID=3028296 RepID=A0AA96ZV92_9EURY|nr:hypothetical protein MsAc7_07180 [Methanosarcinaceae archaeon Ac7]